MLIEAGFETMIADGGEKGIQMAQRQKPGLILLDIILPKMPGGEVCRKLKEGNETQDIPVLLLSAGVDEAFAERCGADGAVSKPFTEDSLLTQVRRFLS
jgi:CheY-like chemotaxis protein